MYPIVSMTTEMKKKVASYNTSRVVLLSSSFLVLVLTSLLLLCLDKTTCDAFHIQNMGRRRGLRLPATTSIITTTSTNRLKSSTADTPVDAMTSSEDDDDDDDEDKTNIAKLKLKLYQYGASFDRGFVANTKSRNDVDDIVQALEYYYLQSDVQASQYVDVSPTTTPLIVGLWRLIWATGSDVVSLGANPFVSVGPIYQDYTNPPVITNVIDVLPRVQALLPPSIAPSSTLRLNVQTKAYKYQDSNSYPNRIVLDFESVKIEPLEFLGQNVREILQPIGFDLPKISTTLLPPPVEDALNDFVSRISGGGGGGGTTGSDVGILRGGSGSRARSNPNNYFDVTYLDDDLLIIKQNLPGGYFVLTKVEDY